MLGCSYWCGFGSQRVWDGAGELKVVVLQPEGGSRSGFNRLCVPPEPGAKAGPYLHLPEMLGSF